MNYQRNHLPEALVAVGKGVVPGHDVIGKGLELKSGTRKECCIRGGMSPNSRFGAILLFKRLQVFVSLDGLWSGEVQLQSFVARFCFSNAVLWHLNAFDSILLIRKIA